MSTPGLGTHTHGPHLLAAAAPARIGIHGARQRLSIFHLGHPCPLLATSRKIAGSPFGTGLDPVLARPPSCGQAGYSEWPTNPGTRTMMQIEVRAQPRGEREVWIGTKSARGVCALLTLR